MKLFLISFLDYSLLVHSNATDFNADFAYYNRFVCVLWARFFHISVICRNNFTFKFFIPKIGSQLPGNLGPFVLLEKHQTGVSSLPSNLQHLPFILTFIQKTGTIRRNFCNFHHSNTHICACAHVTLSSLYYEQSLFIWPILPLSIDFILCW